MTKIAFITNICPHYRVQTFELLAKRYSIEYYFYSEGDEWYWQQKHGKNVGNFNLQNLPGFKIKGVRITPTLGWKLWFKNYDVYIKCINGRFALPMTYLIAKLRRRPFILWTGIWMRIDTRAHRLFFPLTRMMYRHADAIVVYGEHVKRYLLTEGVSAQKIFVANHAVDNTKYNHVVAPEEDQVLRAKLGIPANKQIVLFLGRLESVKGITYLLQAFAALRRTDAVLLIAGEGTLRDKLEDECKQLGIVSQVFFVGYVKPADAFRYYALADIYTLPSITTPRGKETWGLVINEVFNQGVPVIATDAVGAAVGGLIEHGVNGFIVPERNVTALADALRLLLDYPALRQLFGRQAKQKIDTWDNQQMIQGFQSAIESVLSGQGDTEFLQTKEPSVEC